MRRVPRIPPSFLTEAEKQRLLKELRWRSSTMAIRDRVVIELFLGTSIRLQELVDLDIDDVDLDAKHLHVRTKGDVPQVKFLKFKLRFLLRGYLKERRRQGDGECQALFVSNRGTRFSKRQVARRLKRWVKAAEIEKQLTPHSLRHTFVTHLYSRTSDILVVQQASGTEACLPIQIHTHLVDVVPEDAIERL